MVNSERETNAVLRAELSPGPSLPQTSKRTVETSIEDHIGLTEILAGESHAIPLHLYSGTTRVQIRVVEQPTLRVLPGGDERPLMLLMNNPKICAETVRNNQ
jgi:hypothetical protein